MTRAASKRKAEYLLIDISNSYTKIVFASKKRLGKPVRHPTERLSGTLFRRILRERDVTTVFVSSVVPQKNRILKSVVNSARLLFLTPSLDLCIGIDYPEPLSIGADRLANAAAVAQLYGYPAIVVDFGTAVTFDVVSVNGNYLGGVIAPGLEAMTRFLYDRTALLPKLSLREPTRVIGKTTREAMMSGAVFGYRGLVREIIGRLRTENFPRRRPRIIATGGYAGLIARKLPEIQAVHPHLTLEGLRIIANRNTGRAAQWRGKK